MSEQQNSLKVHRLPFTQVPNDLLCSDQISGLAKALWCVFYSKPDNWIFYWREIESHFKEGRDAVRKARNELEKLGYMESEQKRVKSSRGMVWGGMNIELFPYPNKQIQPSVSCTENQYTRNSYTTESNSGETGSTTQETNKDLSQKDLSKKYLSDFLSLPAEEKKDFLKKIWLEKKLKSSPEKYFLFRGKNDWKGFSNLEADIAWWENGYLEKNPISEKKSVVESKEIRDIRSAIMNAMIMNQNDYHFYFTTAPIEKTPSGFVIKVSDEKALRYEEVLKNINVQCTFQESDSEKL